MNAIIGRAGMRSIGIGIEPIDALAKSTHIILYSIGQICKEVLLKINFQILKSIS